MQDSDLAMRNAACSGAPAHDHLTQPFRRTLPRGCEPVLAVTKCIRNSSIEESNVRALGFRMEMSAEAIFSTQRDRTAVLQGDWQQTSKGKEAQTSKSNINPTQQCSTQATENERQQRRQPQAKREEESAFGGSKDAGGEIGAAALFALLFLHLWTENNKAKAGNTRKTMWCGPEVTICCVVPDCRSACGGRGAWIPANGPPEGEDRKSVV